MNDEFKPISGRGILAMQRAKRHKHAEDVFSELAGSMFQQSDRSNVPDGVQVKQMLWGFEMGEFEHADKIKLFIYYTDNRSNRPMDNKIFVFNREMWRIGFEGLIKAAFKKW